MAELFSYVVDEAGSVAYLLTNLLIGGVALMAYFQTRRISLLLIAICSGCWAVIGVGHWVVRHFLVRHPSYSLIMGCMGILDLITLLVCTAAMIWLIRNVADSLPPRLPKQPS